MLVIQGKGATNPLNPSPVMTLLPCQWQLLYSRRDSLCSFYLEPKGTGGLFATHGTTPTHPPQPPVEVWGAVPAWCGLL